jgi:arsenate reductase-like glutaredoxin family protein
MMKKVLLTSVMAWVLSSLSLGAYDLKINMQLLNADLNIVKEGFMTSDKEGLATAIERLAKHTEELLGNQEKFAEMLPKNKKGKAKEAKMSAQIIAHNIQIIRDSIANKLNQSEIIRREEAQRAYTYIEHACFRCHNIVRDVK